MSTTVFLLYGQPCGKLAMSRDRCTSGKNKIFTFRNGSRNPIDLLFRSKDPYPPLSYWDFYPSKADGVATSDIATISSTWIVNKNECHSWFSGKSDRTTLWLNFSNSSKQPLASIRYHPLSTLSPPKIPVRPLSPPFLYKSSYN